MINSLKAEVKKLFTVRSTYVVLIIASVLLLGIVSFYAMGVNNSTPMVEGADIANSALNIATVAVGFVSIIGMLLITNEYRFNTIIYTFTAAKSRLKVVFAKLIVITLFTIATGVLFWILSYVFSMIGIQLGGNEVVTNTDVPILANLGKITFYSAGYGLLSALFAFVVRNQGAAIAMLLFLPNIIEGLLSVFLKSYIDVLPFRALTNILINDNSIEIIANPYLVTAIYSGIYIMVICFLIQYRDAN